MSNSATSNAQNWLSDIIGKVAAYDAAQNNKDWGAADVLREEMQERPLSVLVRPGWLQPGECVAANLEPVEYQILLSTGGPAIRVWGELDGYRQPGDNPRLQWQDWGTPWTDYALDADESAAVQTFASVFYFGE